jgi:sulfatase modifying factor 1
MRTRTLLAVVAVLSATFLLATPSHAQPLVNIDTVTVGDAGNAADTSTGYGAVSNVFRIGKYEVTIGQYTTFLRSVASELNVVGKPPLPSYRINLWNSGMAANTNVAGIIRIRMGGQTPGQPDSYWYTYATVGSANRPIAFVSWFDAARFANWMHNGATNGADTETGAYTLNGATAGVILKNPDARWWIPSEDEWYKAAYYKGGGTNTGYWVYPTQSDVAPGNTIGGATNQANYNNGVYSVTQSSSYSSSQNYLTDAGAFSNSASAYGTFDQGGNVYEWNDTVISGSLRVFRGGSWNDPNREIDLQSTAINNADPTNEISSIGFRVASVPANVILTVEKATNLSGQWQFDRDINVGSMTNTNEFYRLKIRTVVE